MSSQAFVRSLVLPFMLALLAGGCGDDDGGGNENENGNGGGVCGDGVVAPEEQCDQGAANSDTAPDACRTDCREAYCGDAVVDTAETCDDGNASGGDGCTSSCEVEEGWDCSAGSCAPVCGDDLAVGGETCDGTDLGGETCVSIGQAAGELACNVLCEWDITGCTGTTECGDGVVEGDEACDDGNTEDCDGCRGDCSDVETGCGDGYVCGSEACDDGNGNNTDGCLDTCEAASCGDGYVWSGQETCDDGNLTPCDGCSSTCQVEACGNGRVECDETCDDGDGDNSDACPDGVGGTCQSAVCGDGYVWSGQEACDDGNTDDCDGCRGDCSDVETGCGDGYVCGVETCDDGNGDNTDGCPDGVGGTCQSAVCGDGYVWAGHESCDGGLGGETCASLSPAFSGGSLACVGSCHWDTSGCTREASLMWLTLAGGTFDMGNATVYSREQPVHAVTVGAFEMLATEVTVAQYEACVNDGGACTAAGTGTNCNWSDSGYEDHPVNCLDWQQAVEFCTWAGGRLPSEAEWEYAARSGGPSSSYKYPWGNDAATCTYAVLDDGGNGCGTGRTWSVCSKPGGNTVQGLCDMAGNVWEWVEDDWHGDYTDAPTDGSAWVESPRGSYRVRRGGSFDADAHYLRATGRYQVVPSVTSDSLGFRCAR